MPEEIKAANKKPIYHYCNMASLCSIVESHNIWLSNSYVMNDSRENTWIIPFIRQCSSELRSDKTAELLDNILMHYDLNTFTPYVASFSKEGDVLSQWRAYADDGAGVSVAFDPLTFGVQRQPPHLAVTKQGNTGLADVIYDTEFQENYVRSVFRSNVDTYLANPKARVDNYSVGAVASLRMMAPLFKNPAFQEEQEVRIIHIPMIMGDKEDNLILDGSVSPLRFRAVGDRLTSYFELPLSTQEGIEPIVEVITGPKSRANHSEIRNMLSHNGYRNVSVVRSKASYR